MKGQWKVLKMLALKVTINPGLYKEGYRQESIRNRQKTIARIFRGKASTYSYSQPRM